MIVAARRLGVGGGASYIPTPGGSLSATALPCQGWQMGGKLHPNPSYPANPR